MPQPLGPMSATIPPPGTARSTPSRAGRASPPVAGRRTRPRRRSGARSPLIDEAPQDRRGRRVERDVGLEEPVVDGGIAPGRGSMRWSIAVIAPIAVRRSGCAPIPTAPRIAEPRTAVSRTAGTATRNPVTSALIAFQTSLRAGPPQARISVTRTPGRQHRRRDVADGQRRGLDDRAGEVAAAVRRGSGRRRRRGPRVPDRRALARRGTAGRPGRRRRAASRPPRRGAPRS